MHRTESRGAHWRRDAPAADPTWARRLGAHYAPEAGGRVLRHGALWTVDPARAIA
ncbi:MAG: hypothetical protein AAF772_19125 [Acidobacteriota bacterium]